MYNSNYKLLKEQIKIYFLAPNINNKLKNREILHKYIYVYYISF